MNILYSTAATSKVGARDLPSQPALVDASRKGHDDVVDLLLAAAGNKDLALKAAAEAGRVQTMQRILGAPGGLTPAGGSHFS